MGVSVGVSARRGKVRDGSEIETEKEAGSWKAYHALWDKNVWHDIIQEPFKGLAMKIFPQEDPLAYVAHLNVVGYEGSRTQR